MGDTHDTLTKELKTVEATCPHIDTIISKQNFNKRLKTNIIPGELPETTLYKNLPEVNWA